jgi:putative acetyltransferase
MGDRQMSTIGLRPFLPADAERCKSIFAASITELAIEDYSEEQCEAWIAAADDIKAFGKRLAEALTLVATVEGESAGFATLKGADVVDLIYVDPEFARRGVATMLLDALTKLASARGAARLTADVSDTAKPLFERQGYVSERRNLVTLGDEWLANTTMSKKLGAAAPTASVRH